MQPESVNASQHDWLESLAAGIESAGLVTPAVLALELWRPLAPLGNQLALLLEPLTGPAVVRGTASWSHLLRESVTIEALLQRLERGRARRTL